MQDQELINLIKNKFEEISNPARIPLIRGNGTFKAELSTDGIYVDNLGNQPFLKWDVFIEAVSILKANGGQAKKGNAMNSKLGDRDLAFDSVEGHVAHRVYGYKEGDSVFRRITPISCILIWAKICLHKPGLLILDNLSVSEVEISGMFKTHAEMIREAIEELGIASPNSIMDFIRQKYPNLNIKKTSFRADIIGCSVNHSSSHHYPGMPKFLFYDKQEGTYQLLNSETPKTKRKLKQNFSKLGLIVNKFLKVKANDNSINSSEEESIFESLNKDEIETYNCLREGFSGEADCFHIAENLHIGFNLALDCLKKLESKGLVRETKDKWQIIN